MRRVFVAALAGLLAAGLTFTAACSDSDGPTTPGGSRTEREAPDADSDGTGSGSDSGDTGSDEAEGKTGDEDEPDLVGKGLAIAEQRAEKAGFGVQAYDSTGRDRTPVLGRSWQVCFQEPAQREKEGKGEVIRLGVVRTSEKCPEQDGSRNQPELGSDNELPDFTGTSLQVATEALGDSASVEPVDARKGRNVYIPQNWKVCDQSPDPGIRWDGEPVTFQVVKYGERCPS